MFAASSSSLAFTPINRQQQILPYGRNYTSISRRSWDFKTEDLRVKSVKREHKCPAHQIHDGRTVDEDSRIVRELGHTERTDEAYITVRDLRPESSKPLNLPPGPSKLPLIGNLHQLVGTLPHRGLADLAKKYGPLMHLQLGEIPTIIVSSSDVLKEIINNHDTIFADRPTFLASRILFYNSTNIAFSPYGDYWRQLRKICMMELLSPKRVQSFESLRKDEVLNMIKSISSKKGSAVNLTHELDSLTFSIVARAAFGKRSKYHDEFVSVMGDAMKLLSGFNIADLYPSFTILEEITGQKPKLEVLHKQIDKVLENILEEHRVKSEEHNAEPVQDLVDVLLRIQKSGEFGAPLTDDNLKAVCFDMFVAGGETTATTIAWTMAEMMRNPKTMERAQEEVRRVYGDMGSVDESQLHELKYLLAVIKEAMRLHPAAPLLAPKENREQCKVKGYDIPVKTRMMVNAWAIHRDPQHWSEPEEFIPERFLDSETDVYGRTFNYIPFGTGRRNCVGISFALPTVELPLAQLLYHFDWKLPGDSEQVDMTEAFGVATRLKNDLRLIPIPHHPSSP